MVPLYIGFDPRESAAFHVFSQSVIQTATEPIALIPLALPLLKGYAETHTDGSNAFIYSRFLIPHLQSFSGWAIFCDGDMVCLSDIAGLWSLRDESKAVMVVKHNYRTKTKRKYIGTSMETHNADYPRKNWSSVMLWNCGHPSNYVLTPEYVMGATGQKLHRFEHLKDEEIGELPREWNHLATEQEHNPQAKLIHYTLGVPGIAHYAASEGSEHWFKAFEAVTHIDT